MSHVDRAFVFFSMGFTIVAVAFVGLLLYDTSENQIVTVTPDSPTDIFPCWVELDTETESYNRPSIATDGSNIIVVWEKSSSSIWGIYYSTSIDGGATFSSPQNLSNDPGDSFSPQVATDGSNIIVVWVGTASGNPEIYYSTSIDGGATFSSPQNLSNDPGDSFSPQVATDGSNIIVVWEEHGADFSDIYYSTSIDGGATFSSPQNLRNDPVKYFRPQVATSGSNIIVVWEEQWADFSEIYYSTSIDGGATFGYPDNISPVQGIPLIYYTNPHVATSGSNIIFVLERLDGLTGFSEIYYSTSIDGGATFGYLQRISQDIDDYSYALDPHVATSGSNIIVVWKNPSISISDISDIYYGASIDGGATFSTPKKITSYPEEPNLPSVAIDGSEAFAVWVGGDDGDIIFTSGIIKSPNSKFPCVP